MEEPPVQYHPYQKLHSVSDVIDLLRSPKTQYIAVDTETNGKDVRSGLGLCYGISFSTKLPALGYIAYYVPVNHPTAPGYPISSNVTSDELFELKRAMLEYKGYYVFHNAKFDLESLRTIGIDIQHNRVFCTMLMCHLINENLPFSKGLDSCGKWYLKDPGKKMGSLFEMFKSLYGWEGMPYEVICDYAEYDAVLTIRLFEAIYERFCKEVPLDDYWFNHKMPFMRVIIKMERRGIRTDVPLCKRMLVHGAMIMEDIREELNGKNPGSSKDLHYLLIEQLGLPTVKPTKTTAKLPEDQWKPSFDKAAMEVYDRILERRDNPLAVHILTYRGWQKACSSNYKPYIELLGPDGKLRPNYKLHGTKTGRMSCEQPNLQQIPRAGDKPWNGEMKTAFLPSDDTWELWEFDYGQLEFRLAACYAMEPRLLEIFNADPERDIFTEMSKDLGMPRHDTKTLTYTIQYGGGIKRISDVFNKTPNEAESIRSNFYISYPNLGQITKLASQKAKFKGKVQLWSGRHRHFLNPKNEAHKAFNSVIQGGAADVVERTMIRLFNQVDNDAECRMLLQVHDSVVFEIKKNKVEEYIPRILEVMENVEPREFSERVRFKVDAHRFGE